MDRVVASSYHFYHQLLLFHLTLPRSLWLYSFWLTFLSLCWVLKVLPKKISIVISIVSSSIYIMKSPRCGFLLWYLLIFDNSLFQLPARPPGSFEAIKHDISGEVKVFHLWLAATLLHFSKKQMEFSKSPCVSKLGLWPIFYFLSVGDQYLVWVAIHFFKKYFAWVKP